MAATVPLEFIAIDVPNKSPEEIMVLNVWSYMAFDELLDVFNPQSPVIVDKSKLYTVPPELLLGSPIRQRLKVLLVEAYAILLPKLKLEVPDPINMF